MTLQPGSVLVLFSDGLIERRDEDLSESLQHLIEQLGRLGRAASAAEVFDAVRRDGCEDDATVLTLARLPQPEQCSRTSAVLAQV